MDPLNPDPPCNPHLPEPTKSTRRTRTAPGGQRLLPHKQHRFTSIVEIKASGTNQLRPTELSLVAVLDKLFTGLRDDKTTRAAAQKVLLAIEAEDRQRFGTTCHACGQLIPASAKTSCRE